MLFTISIPAYNRRKLLERNLIHLEEQKFDKSLFEVILVDDGSTDDTEEFVEEYLKKTNLSIRYIKQENQGKYMALRKAIIEAKGKYFINCDSDDYLHEDALAKLKILWDEIENNQIEIAGIIGHKLLHGTSQITGNRFPENVIFSDPIEMRFKYNITGDKFPCFKTSILKKHNFPDYSRYTKFVPESYLFYSISLNYQFKYVNDFFLVCEYQHGGLSSNIQRYRIKNAFGCLKVYELYVNNFSWSKTIRGYFRNYINYVRFSSHTRNHIKINTFFDPILAIFGYMCFINDKLKF